MPGKQSKHNRPQERKVKFNVVLEKDEDGFWVVTVPLLPGCITQGRSRSEALRLVREAIEFHLEEVGPRGGEAGTLERARIIHQGLALDAVLVHNASGHWLGEVPGLAGCYAQGSTRAEAVARLGETLQLLEKTGGPAELLHSELALVAIRPKGKTGNARGAKRTR